MTEITAGVLGGLLVFALILTLSVYRKWKIEQEIEGLLWKINPESLQGHREGLHSCASRQSLGSMISGKIISTLHYLPAPSSVWPVARQFAVISG